MPKPGFAKPGQRGKRPPAPPPVRTPSLPGSRGDRRTTTPPPTVQGPQVNLGKLPKTFLPVMYKQLPKTVTAPSPLFKQQGPGPFSPYKAPMSTPPVPHTSMESLPPVIASAASSAWPTNPATGKPMFLNIADMPGAKLDAPSLDDARFMAFNVGLLPPPESGDLTEITAQELATVAYAYISHPQTDKTSAAAKVAFDLLDIDYDPTVVGPKGTTLKALGTLLQPALNAPGVKQVLEYVSYPARIIESMLSGSLLAADPEITGGMIFSATPGGIPLVGPVADMQQQVRTEAIDQQRRVQQAYTEAVEGREWGQVFNVFSELGYTVLSRSGGDPNYVTRLFADIDRDIPWPELMEKYQDLGVELVMQSLLDPLNFLPQNLFEKAFPLHAKIGEGIYSGVEIAAKGGRKVVLGALGKAPAVIGTLPFDLLGSVKDFFVGASKKTQLTAYVFAARDAIGELSVRASMLGVEATDGGGIDLFKVFERAITGDESVLKMLGTNSRRQIAELGKWWNTEGIQSVQDAFDKWMKKLNGPSTDRILEQAAKHDPKLQEWFLAELVQDMRAQVLGIDLNKRPGLLGQAFMFTQQLLRENFLATWAYKLGNLTDNNTKIVLQGYNPVAFGWNNWARAEEFYSTFFAKRVEAGVNSSFLEDAMSFHLKDVLATERLPWPLGKPSAFLEGLGKVSDSLLGTKFTSRATREELADFWAAHPQLSRAAHAADEIMGKLSWAGLPKLGVRAILESSAVYEKTARTTLGIQAAMKHFEQNIRPAVLAEAKQLQARGIIPADAVTELATHPMSFQYVHDWAERWKLQDVTVPVLTPVSRLASHDWSAVQDAADLMQSIEIALDRLEAVGTPTPQQIQDLFDNATIAATRIAGERNATIRNASYLDLADIAVPDGLLVEHEIPDYLDDLKVAMTAERRNAWTEWWNAPGHTRQGPARRVVEFDTTNAYKTAFKEIENLYAQSLATGVDKTVEIQAVYDDMLAAMRNFADKGIEAAKTPVELQTINDYVRVTEQYVADRKLTVARAHALDMLVKQKRMPAWQAASLKADLWRAYHQRTMEAMGKTTVSQFMQDVAKARLDGVSLPVPFTGDVRTVVDSRGMVRMMSDLQGPELSAATRSAAQAMLDQGMPQHTLVTAQMDTGIMHTTLGHLANPATDTTARLIEGGAFMGYMPWQDVMTIKVPTLESRLDYIDMLQRIDPGPVDRWPTDEATLRDLALGAWCHQSGVSKGRFVNGEWIVGTSGVHPSVPEATVNDVLFTVFPDHLELYRQEDTDPAMILQAVQKLLQNGVSPDQPVALYDYFNRVVDTGTPGTNTLGGLYNELVSGAQMTVVPPPVQVAWTSNWSPDVQAISYNPVTGKIQYATEVGLPASKLDVVARVSNGELIVPFVYPEAEQAIAQALMATGLPDHMPYRNVMRGQASLGDVAAGRNLNPGLPAEAVQLQMQLSQEAQQLALEALEKTMNWNMADQWMKEMIDATNGQLARVMEELSKWQQAALRKLSTPAQQTLRQPLGAADQAALEKLMRTWLDGAEVAGAYGGAEVRRTLFNYWENSRAREMLTVAFPFSKWQLSNPGLWLQLFSKHPGLLATAIRVRATTEELRKRQGLTSRFDDTAPMPILQGLADAGMLPPGYWAWDPMQLLSIFGQVNEPFLPDEAQQLTGWQKTARDVLGVTESVGLTPWPWWKEALRAGGVYPEQQANFPIGALGRFPPVGTALDRAVQRAINGGKPDDAQVYRINRRLAEMLAEGRITQAQATAARDNPSHPVYKQAEADVNAVRDVATGVRAFEPFRLQYASVGEQRIRQDLKELGQIKDALEQQRFIAARPWLRAYWSTQDSLAERQYDAARDQIMERYETQLNELYPWDPARKAIYAARTKELDALETQYADKLPAKQPLTGDPRSQSDTLRRLRDMEPKPEQFSQTVAGGPDEINWDAYDKALQQFQDGIPALSKQMGFPITRDQYDVWRNDMKDPLEQAWLLQQRAINGAYDLANHEVEGLQTGPAKRAFAEGRETEFIHDRAAKLAPPRNPVDYTDTVAQRTGLPVSRVRELLSGIPQMPGAGTPRTELQKLQAEYYALQVEERERFRVRFSIPENMTVAEWLSDAPEVQVTNMLAELRADPKWLLLPTPRQSFWDVAAHAVILPSAYDDPILGPVLNSDARNTFNFTQEQYDAAYKYLRENYDRFVDVARMTEARIHPDWWREAQGQRELYRRVTASFPEMRSIEQAYFAVPEENREQWKQVHAAEWQVLTQYWDVKNNAKFSNPYYTYFFDRESYTQWFGGENPELVRQRMTELAPLWEQARKDMDAYERARAEGHKMAWTPAMVQFFGQKDAQGNPVTKGPTMVSQLWDYIYSLPPGYSDWHKQLYVQSAYQVVMQLQSLKRTDWVNAIPDATAQKALKELRAWVANNPPPVRPDTVDYWTRERALPLPTWPEEQRVVRDSRSQWNAAQAASDFDAMDNLIKLYGALWGRYGYYVPKYGSYRPKDKDSTPVGGSSGGGSGPGGPPPPPPPPPPF